MKNTFKFLIAGVLLAFGSVASASLVNTLVVDFGGVYGGTLDTNTNGAAVGDNINISTITVEDDTGTNVYDVTGGLLNFNTGASGFEITITGAVVGLNIIDGSSVLFEGSFTDWSLTNGLSDVFVGNGSGIVGSNVMDNVLSDGDNPFAFTGFSLQSANGNVLSTDFLMTATGSKDVPAVPIPAAAWLFGSGLLGLVGVARRKV